MKCNGPCLQGHSDPNLLLFFLLPTLGQLHWPSCFPVGIPGSPLLLDICIFLSQSQKFSALKRVTLLMPSCLSALYFGKALLTSWDKIPLLHSWAPHTAIHFLYNTFHCLPSVCLPDQNAGLVKVAIWSVLFTAMSLAPEQWLAWNRA